MSLVKATNLKVVGVALALVLLLITMLGALSPSIALAGGGISKQAGVTQGPAGIDGSDEGDNEQDEDGGEGREEEAVSGRAPADRAAMIPVGNDGDKDPASREEEGFYPFEDGYGDGEWADVALFAEQWEQEVGTEVLEQIPGKGAGEVEVPATRSAASTDKGKEEASSEPSVRRFASPPKGSRDEDDARSRAPERYRSGVPALPTDPDELRSGLFPGLHRHVSKVAAMKLVTKPAPGGSRELLVVDSENCVLFSLDGRGRCEVVAGNGVEVNGCMDFYCGCCGHSIEKLDGRNPRRVAIGAPQIVEVLTGGQILLLSPGAQAVLELSPDRTRVKVVARSMQQVAVPAGQGLPQRMFRLGTPEAVLPTADGGFLLSTGSTGGPTADDDEWQFHEYFNGDGRLEDPLSDDENDEELGLGSGMPGCPLEEDDFCEFQFDPERPKRTAGVARGLRDEDFFSARLHPSVPVGFDSESEDSIDDDHFLEIPNLVNPANTNAPASLQMRTKQAPKIWKLTPDGWGGYNVKLVAGGGTVRPTEKAISAKRIGFSKELKLGQGRNNQVILFDGRHVYRIDERGKLKVVFDLGSTTLTESGELRAVVERPDGRIVLDDNQVWLLDADFTNPRMMNRVGGAGIPCVVVSDGTLLTAHGDVIYVTGRPAKEVPTLKELAAAVVRENLRRMEGGRADEPQTAEVAGEANAPTVVTARQLDLWGKLVRLHPELSSSDTVQWLRALRDRVISKSASPARWPFFERVEVDSRASGTSPHGGQVTVWRAQKTNDLHAQTYLNGEWGPDRVIAHAGDGFIGSRPAVAEDGGAFVLWMHEDPFLQMFASVMAPTGEWGPHFQVSENATAPHDRAAVAVSFRAGGRGVIAWSSFHFGEGHRLNVRFRSEDGDWSPVHRVANSRFGTQQNVELTDGPEAVVVWTDGVSSATPRDPMSEPNRRVLKAAIVNPAGVVGPVALLSKEGENAGGTGLFTGQHGGFNVVWTESVGLAKFKPKPDPFPLRTRGLNPEAVQLAWLNGVNQMRCDKPATAVRTCRLMPAGLRAEIDSEPVTLSSQNEIAEHICTAGLHRKTALVCWRGPFQVGRGESVNELSDTHLTRILASVRTESFGWQVPVDVFGETGGNHKVLKPGFVHWMSAQGDGLVIAQDAGAGSGAVTYTRAVDSKGVWMPTQTIVGTDPAEQGFALEDATGQLVLVRLMSGPHGRQALVMNLQPDGSWGAASEIDENELLALLSCSHGALGN